MSDDFPSNAVLEAKIDAMSATILANQTINAAGDALNLTQVTKINGRVSSLEKYKNMMVGALGIIVVLILPILFKLF